MWVGTLIKIRSLHLFLVHLLLVLGGGVLVLLVLRDEIVHVGLGLGELHLVHTFTGVPMEESLSSEHGGELFSDSLEHLLDGGGVTKEGNSHLESLRGDVANGGLDVVGDPFNEVGVGRKDDAKCLSSIVQTLAPSPKGPKY